MSNQEHLLRAISFASDLALALRQSEFEPHDEELPEKLSARINAIREELDCVERSFAPKGT